MNFEVLFEKFEKLQGFMINDLRNSTVYGHANFLVAMGIFNYIEILGGYCNPTGNCTERFNFVFENLLSEEYKEVFHRIKNIREPYNILRCGMSHEYFIKTEIDGSKRIKIIYQIQGVNDEYGYNICIRSKKCGLELIKNNEHEFYLRVVNPRFIHDFNLAIEKYKKNLVSDHNDYRKNFVTWATEVNLESFN